MRTATKVKDQARSVHLLSMYCGEVGKIIGKGEPEKCCVSLRYCINFNRLHAQGNKIHRCYGIDSAPKCVYQLAQSDVNSDDVDFEDCI